MALDCRFGNYCVWRLACRRSASFRGRRRGCDRNDRRRNCSHSAAVAHSKIQGAQVSKVRFLALGEAQRSRAKESATCAQRAKRAIKIGILTLCTTVCGCTQANLTNGKSTASYKGVKVFSPTVLSLRTGNCAVPGVDAAGRDTEPPPPPRTGTKAPA